MFFAILFPSTEHSGELLHATRLLSRDAHCPHSPPPHCWPYPQWAEAQKGRPGNIRSQHNQVGKDLQRSSDPTPCSKLSQPRASKEGYCTASPGNLFHCLTLLLVKTIFFLSSPNLSSFNMSPLSLVLQPHAATVLSLDLSSRGPHHSYSKAALRSPTKRASSLHAQQAGPSATAPHHPGHPLLNSFHLVKVFLT